MNSMPSFLPMWQFSHIYYHCYNWCVNMNYYVDISVMWAWMDVNEGAGDLLVQPQWPVCLQQGVPPQWLCMFQIIWAAMSAMWEWHIWACHVVPWGSSKGNMDETLGKEEGGLYTWVVSTYSSPCTCHAHFLSVTLPYIVYS